MRKFSLISKILEYNTSYDKSNVPESVSEGQLTGILVSGSKNVLIDGRNGKVKSRGGLSRLGAANESLTPIRNAKTWNNSTGGELPVRFYDDELEVYLNTLDGIATNAWTRILSGWSTTETMRFALWWDATENIDLLLMVIGDANLYEWSGAVAIVDSITSVTITKKGTKTFGESRFYTTRNKIVKCVRTGTEYTYTGGESTLTLTGIADTTGLVAGDILVQKVVTYSNTPSATRTNDTIFTFENQVVIGSFDDNEVAISQNNDVDDFSYSAPRIAGEGGLLTLDAPSKGIGTVGKYLLLFSGRDSIFRANYMEITIGSTLSETLTVKKFDSVVEQGCQSPDCIISIGDSLAYLTYEPTLRIISNPDNIGGINPTTLSNPIKPDFDAEDWTNAFGTFNKNIIYLSSPANSRMYMLEFIQDASGNTRKFWQAPQYLSVRAFSIIDGDLYIHSNAVPESFKLFDGLSDINSSDEKLPIEAIACMNYRNFGNRQLLKGFDEWYVEGEINQNTNDLYVTINYNYNGSIQSLNNVIDGSDEAILEGEVGGISLGQAALGQEPLGGSSTAPADARKFRTIVEIAKEEFNEIQAVFSTNGVDKYFSILASGPNAWRANNRSINIKK